MLYYNFDVNMISVLRVWLRMEFSQLIVQELILMYLLLIRRIRKSVTPLPECIKLFSAFCFGGLWIMVVKSVLDLSKRIFYSIATDFQRQKLQTPFRG